MSSTEKGYLMLKYPFKECLKCNKVDPEIRKVMDFGLNMSGIDIIKLTKPDFHLEVTCSNSDLCEELKDMFSHEKQTL